MKFTALMALVLAGTALTQNSTFTSSTTAYPSTTIVSALTTVCGAATVLTQNGNYYTCTESMTLTITDCPCTMTHSSYMTYATAPTTTASTSTIIVPAFCPTTTAASTLVRNAQAGYTPTCQAAGAAGYTPSVGSTMLPSATHGYLYTSAAVARFAASMGLGKAVAATVGFGALCALLI